MPKNERLKRAIEEIKSVYKLNQAEIAEKLGVRSTYLSDVINGRVPLSGNIVSKLSELFHINKAWLEGGWGAIMYNTSTVDEPAATYNTQRTEVKGYEQIIRALESIIAAKDETILSQRCAIEALKREVEAVKKLTGFFTKEAQTLE